MESEVKGGRKLLLICVLAGFIFVDARVAFCAESTPDDSRPEDSLEDSRQKVVLVDKVIASVDGEPITWSDLRRFAAAKGETLSKEIDSSDEKLLTQLRDLIVDTMLRNEAKESGITVGDEEIDAYILEIQRQNNLDEEGFKEVLKGRGLGWEEYRGQIRSDILRARIVSAKVRSKINVPDEDVDRFLEEHSELVPEEGTVHLYQIVVRKSAISEDAGGSERELIEAMRGELETGTEWPLVGGEYYEDLGYVNPENLKEELGRVVQTLEVGEISDVIETSDSFRILSVTSRSSGENRIDKQARDEVRNTIYERKFRKKVEEYLGEELPKKYHVEMKL